MSVVAGDSQGVCLLRAQSQHDEVLHAALAEFFKVRVVPKIHPDVLFPGAMGGSLAFTIVALDDDVPTKLEQVLRAARLFPFHRHTAIVPSMHPRRVELMEKLAGKTQLMIASSSEMVRAYVLKAAAANKEQGKLSKAAAYFEGMLQTDIAAFEADGHSFLRPSICDLPSLRPLERKALSHCFENFASIVAADEGALRQRCALLGVEQARETASFFGAEDGFVGASLAPQ